MFRRSRHTLALLSTLVLGVFVVSSSLARADEIEEAKKYVLEIAKLVEEGKDKDVAAKVAEAKKKFELAAVMAAYKPKAKKGIGVGADGTGIELKLAGMEKRAIPAATLQKEKDDLIKMAYVNIALGHLTKAYAPEKPKAGKGAKQWNEHSDAMNKETLELIKLIKSGEGAKIKAAAAKINTACTNCHTDFRD